MASTRNVNIDKELLLDFKQYNFSFQLVRTYMEREWNVRKFKPEYKP